MAEAKFKIGDNVVVTGVLGKIEEVIRVKDEWSYIISSDTHQWLSNHVIVEEAVCCINALEH